MFSRSEIKIILVLQTKIQGVLQNMTFEYRFQGRR